MSPEHPKAIALLSGGLDSTVALAEGLTQYHIELCITFDYGQRAMEREVEASKKIARHYAVHHEVVKLPWLKKLLPQHLDSAQGGASSPWREGDQDKIDFFEAHPVWVPNRNGVFLNIGAAYAETYEAPCILFGANAEEAERFPDNTEAFRDSLNAVFKRSTLTHPKVVTPVGHLDKKGIIDRAIEHQVPLHLIWSCYGGDNQQCGKCPSCVRLKQALQHTEQGKQAAAELFS